MNSLNLPNPKMMDVAVPANMRIGLAQKIVAERGWAISAEEAKALAGDCDVAIIDLREEQERKRDGVIPGSLHVAYPTLRESLKADGLLQQLAKSAGKRPRVLLLIRRTLGDGRAGGAGRRSRRRAPHCRRHAGLEAGRRSPRPSVTHQAASAGLTRFTISPPRSRSTRAMSY
jgi:hypothetical protein